MHAVAHTLNQQLGNIGATVLYTDPIEANPVDQVASLRDLVNDMRSGQVETLLIGGNPVYDAPADLGFLDALKKIQFRAHLGLYANETAVWCQWHVPEAHYLELWGDARGTMAPPQLCSPSSRRSMAAKRRRNSWISLPVARAGLRTEAVRQYWQAQHKGADFEDFWQTALHDGVIAGTAFPTKMPPAPHVPERTTTRPAGLEIVFRPYLSFATWSFRTMRGSRSYRSRKTK